MFIGNKWVDATSGRTIPCVNPANETEFDTVPAGGNEDVDAAVRAARAAFDGGWKRSDPARRAELLRNLARNIRESRERLGELETIDNGKPLAEALYDVDTAAQIFDMYADLTEQFGGWRGTELELPVDYLKTTVTYQPLGVVALITPWNFPIEQFTWKVAAAIAAGCACVVKPSEVTSLTALALAELVQNSGFPAGVLNVVTGYGREAGEALVHHPGVDKVSFTGSTATGRRIMSLAAATLKRVSLELGGKSPVIVFGDVKLDRAVEWVMFGAFVNQGQVCTSTSRLLLHESIAPLFLDKLKEGAQSIVVGDGRTAGVQMGPLASAEHYNKVTGYVAAGLNEGAELLTGGGRPKGLNNGYFLEPTIFTKVEPHMSIWRDEIFGPVLSVKTFTDEAEAIALANDTDYGLAATVLSEDVARAERVVDQIDAGITWQNCNQMVVMQAPWGGMKKSGFGRELGKWGLEAFLEVKQRTRWLPDGGLGWYRPAA
ncbi:aldehyde dehydrogenase family protein [Pseudaminobacter sp. NGMCC 1.201702]|uniref:aldehyde dehydrogenase family protein n=1 Tax=Pseudaminobacter sp. NGMCC 1.201702 TaxID=3391825 RepID=UPI0039F12E85